MLQVPTIHPVPAKAIFMQSLIVSLVVSKDSKTFPSRSSTLSLAVIVFQFPCVDIDFITNSSVLFLIYPSSTISLDKLAGYKKESVLSPVDSSLSMQ